ncbi:RHS repeat domain-containing protein [Apibacter adventoris]|uniref:RHS repeat domain-containing protein n=1 Tax=Apibacter adventoris TaxID=1679466 RepID=UPI001C887967|nr:RHS repeat-associated core domain-containing protein [Apibacter adventoris]
MQYYYHADHLGSSSYITNLDAQIVQHVEYVPFGEVFIEERNQSWNTPYLFKGKELDEETGLYYYGARYYNPRKSIFLSVEPMFEETMTSYQYTYQNPIKFIDPTGMSAEDGGGDPTPNKLTGSKNLLVYLNENNKQTDYSKMYENSGDWDYVIVNNIDEVAGIMKNHYGDDVPKVENLVIRSHGHTDKRSSLHGPDLDNKVGTGIVHNPASSPGLTYLRGILSDNASIVFTACNAVMGYTDNSNGLQKSSRSLASNYSEFFLKGTNRNLFFNWAKSHSRLAAGNKEYFAFDSDLHRDKFEGYAILL